MGFISKIGGALNDIMGISSSAKQQQQAQMGLQKDAQAYSTWQMQNAHQIETQDLKNSGLNPVLSANGGASAGVVEGGASTGVSGADPIGMITNIINTMNNSARTEADIKNQTDKTKAEVNKLMKEAGFTEKQIEFYNKTGTFPGASYSRSISGNGNITVGKDGVSIGGGGSYSETNPITAKGQKFRYKEINDGNENNNNKNKEYKYKITKTLKKLLTK